MTAVRRTKHSDAKLLRVSYGNKKRARHNTTRLPPLHSLLDSRELSLGVSGSFLRVGLSVLAKFGNLRFSGSRENQELAQLANGLAGECFEKTAVTLANNRKLNQSIIQTTQQRDQSALGVCATSASAI